MTARSPLRFWLQAPALLLATYPGVADLRVERVERVSVSGAGAQGSLGSGPGFLSADGHHVAFEANSPEFKPPPPYTGTGYCAYLRNRDCLTTEMVSVNDSGQGDNYDSWGASVSVDGSAVVFSSLASNLVMGDTNGCQDVFVRDRRTAHTTRVSVSGSGVQSNGGSGDATLSADGRSVVFVSEATNLVPGDTNGQPDVFVHDRQTAATTRVSVGGGGLEANGPSFSPSVSANGRFVAFSSLASNLVSGDTNQCADVFLRDVSSQRTTRLSVTSAGVQGNADSLLPNAGGPCISADGRLVVFESGATNLAPDDTNSTGDVFLRDCATAETRRVSLSSTGAQLSGFSCEPAISGNGRFVAFVSSAADVLLGGSYGTYHVWLRDLLSGDVACLSASVSGEEGNGDSCWPSVSADGNCVAFTSWATNLVSEDTNGCEDVFAVEVGQSGPAGCRLSGRIARSATLAHGGTTAMLSSAAGAVETTTPDRDGRFSFQPVPAGVYEIRPARADTTFVPPELTISVERDRDDEYVPAAVEGGGSSRELAGYATLTC